MKLELDLLRVQLREQRLMTEAMQARIDELMLEYCPDEMTPEQIEEWGRHQKPVSEETAKRIDAAIASGAGEQTTEKEK